MAYRCTNKDCHCHKTPLPYGQCCSKCREIVKKEIQMKPDHFHCLPSTPDPLSGFYSSGPTFHFCYSENCADGVTPEYAEYLKEFPKLVRK